MKAYYDGLMICLQFFSIFPIRMEVQMSEKNIERSIRLFPFLGIIFGFIYAGTAFVLQSFTSFSDLIISFIIWLLAILLTGGIHLDGWLDTADAFFSYQDPKDRLEIMSDPRVGAFGVIGAIVLFIAKLLFIYETLVNSNPFTYLFILLIPFFSRSLMGGLLTFVPNAKEKGLGQLFQSAKGPKTISFYFIYLVVISLSLFIIKRQLLIGFIFLSLTSFVSFFFIKKKAIHWFGGTTGDVIGAATEGLEVFLWLILLNLQSFGMV